MCNDLMMTSPKGMLLKCGNLMKVTIIIAIIFNFPFESNFTDYFERKFQPIFFA